MGADTRSCPRRRAHATRESSALDRIPVLLDALKPLPRNELGPAPGWLGRRRSRVPSGCPSAQAAVSGAVLWSHSAPLHSATATTLGHHVRTPASCPASATIGHS